MAFVIIAVLAGVYCLVRALLDLRQKRYVWAVLGLAVGIALLAMPVPTYSVAPAPPVDAGK
ncbi:MAG: hypothetical protein PW843_23970 [Azospirillaceae bacterium]|nr:hypothetical protein [Azospirillaceae bacterium]